MESIRKPSVRVILWSRRARKQSKMEEITSMVRSITSKLLGVMPPAKITGKAKTIQILKILLPTILPTNKSLSPFLAAITVVTSSGKEVPRAMMVSEMMRSEIPTASAMVEAEFTTSWLPPTTPAKPKITKRKDLPILYLGFSTFLASFLFLRASEKR